MLSISKLPKLYPDIEDEQPGFLTNPESIRDSARLYYAKGVPRANEVEG